MRVIGTCTWEMCGMIVMMAKKAEGMIVEWGGVWGKILILSRENVSWIFSEERIKIRYCFRLSIG